MYYQEINEPFLYINYDVMGKTLLDKNIISNHQVVTKYTFKPPGLVSLNSINHCLPCYISSCQTVANFCTDYRSHAGGTVLYSTRLDKCHCVDDQ